MSLREQTLTRAPEPTAPSQSEGRTLPEHLRAGDRFQATAVRAPDQTSGPPRGVRIDGEFYELALPRGTKSGDSITLEVVVTSKRRALRVVQEQSESGRSSDPSLKSLLSSSISDLEQLNTQLREVLRGGRSPLSQVQRVLSQQPAILKELVNLDKLEGNALVELITDKLVELSSRSSPKSLASQVHALRLNDLNTALESTGTDRLDSGTSEVTRALIPLVRMLRQAASSQAAPESELTRFAKEALPKLASLVDSPDSSDNGVTIVSRLLGSLKSIIPERAERELHNDINRELTRLNETLLQSKPKEGAESSSDAIDKLRRLLTSLRTNVESEITEQALREAVRSQIDKAQSQAPQIQRLILALDQDAPLRTFLATLDSLERGLPSTGEAVDQRLTKFLSEIRTEVTTKLKEAVPERELRELLQRLQTDLKEQFVANPSSQEVKASELKPLETLSLRHQQAVRTLYSQLESLLNLNEPLISRSGSGPSPAKPLAELMELLKSLTAEKRSSGSGLELHGFADSLLKAITAHLKEGLSESDLRALLSDALRGLKTQFMESTRPAPASLAEGTLQQLLNALTKAQPKPNYQGESDVPHLDSLRRIMQELRSLPKAISNPQSASTLASQVQDLDQMLLTPKATEKVAALVRELAKTISTVRDLTQSSPEQGKLPDLSTTLDSLRAALNELERNLASGPKPGYEAAQAMSSKALQLTPALKTLLKDPEVQAALLMLSQSSLRNNSDLPPVASQFLNFAQQLLEHLDADTIPLRNSSTAARQDSLNQLKEAFLRQNSSNSGRSGDLDTLRQLENLFRSMDYLNQVNPLMRAAGEPALILFPHLIHGLLHQSALALYPRRPEQSDDKEGESNGQSQGQGERVQLALELPGLGSVTVDLYTDRERVNLRFGTPTQEKADFIEERLPKLIKRLAELSYDEVETNVAAESDSDCTPGWVKNLIDEHLTVA